MVVCGGVRLLEGCVYICGVCEEHLLICWRGVIYEGCVCIRWYGRDMHTWGGVVVWEGMYAWHVPL